MRFLIDGQTLSTPEINRGIGVVFKRLCEELVINDISKEWLITVHDISDLKYFSAAVQRRLTPIEVNESLNKDGYVEQTKHYSQVLNRIAAESKIDAYWVPNPLMMNVVLPTDLCDVTIFATVYDVIPLMMPHDYVHGWPEHLQREYQRRVDSLAAWADKLIFISESSRSDFKKLYFESFSKSVVIPLAVDHTKFWTPISPRSRAKSPYILFTGGFDPRKNMAKALEAFSHLVKDHSKEFETLKLYIVCACSDESRKDYEKLATQLGVLDRLVLTGHVEDDELVALYRGASVFFFPSRYEGFGLPVLEALACGLPVVTTNVSSIPEVIGDLAYYCSTNDSKDMALALREALCEGTSGQSRRQKSIRRAREFTWAKTAADYSKLFTDTLLETQNSKDLQHRKIAYLSPWPPQRSGIADYSLEIVRHLKEYVDITLYLENPEECSTDNLDLSVHNITLLPEEIKRYDCIIYHIGSNTKFHKYIYKMAWQYPGIVVLHEFNIHPFMVDAFLGNDDEYLYVDALKEGYGEQGKFSYESVKSNESPPGIWEFPMSHALAKRSLATIVHSQWVKNQLQGINNVFVVPMGSNTKKTFSRFDVDEILRRRLSISTDNFLISTFGFVNRFKRIPKILEAIKVLLDLGYPVQFLIGGDLIEKSLKLEETINSLGISDNVIISGYLNDEEFEACLRMSDIIFNLRCPSLGESSAALMRALGCGKTCIVSNYQQFAELPDSVCWKVDVDDLEVQQIVAYLKELMHNPTARKQLGKNAVFFAENYSSYGFAGKLYANVISRVARNQLRLTHKLE